MNNDQPPPTRGFITYPNQTVWKVDKPISQDRLFLQVDAGDADKALTILGKSAMRLWFHLMAHRNGFEFGFSPIAVEKAIGMKRDGCKAARKELIEKGYLEHINGNRYILHSSPINRPTCRLPDDGGKLHLHGESPSDRCENYPPWVENAPLVGGETPPDEGKLHQEIIKDNKDNINIIKDTVFDDFNFSSGRSDNDIYSFPDDTILFDQKENEMDRIVLASDNEEKETYTRDGLTPEEMLLANRVNDARNFFYGKDKKIRWKELSTVFNGVQYEALIPLILYRYAGSGENFKKLLRLGKNGIVIDGWDVAKAQPIIKCSPIFVPPELMVQHPENIKRVLGTGYLNDMPDQDKSEAQEIMREWQERYWHGYYYNIPQSQPNMTNSDDAQSKPTKGKNVNIGGFVDLDGDDGDLPF